MAALLASSAHATVYAGVLLAFAILLTLERMHKTLRAILVHTIKLPNETARPTDSYL